MIKKCKEDALILLRSNKRLLIPIYLWMVSNSLIYYIWNSVMSCYTVVTSDLLIIIMFTTILILQFAVEPISLFCFYKMFAQSNSNNVIYPKSVFLSKNILRNAMLINLPQMFLNLLIIISVSSNLIFFTQNRLLLLIAIVLQIIVYPIMFFCNYLLAQNEYNVKELIYLSIKKMKTNIKKILLFTFSFTGWFLLTFIIRLLIEIILSDNMFSLYLAITFRSFNPIINSFSACLYGIGLFVWPYIFATQAYLCKNMLFKTQ